MEARPEVEHPADASGAHRARARRGSRSGIIGASVLILMLALCVFTLPWTLGSTRVQEADGRERRAPRYNAGTPGESRLPPSWWTPTPDQTLQLNALVPEERARAIAQEHGVGIEAARAASDGDVARAMRGAWPRYLLGTDVLGNSVLIRCLAGGGISLCIGIAAAALSVLIGTLYGTISGYAGGRVDDAMMRFVDVLYGLPYILLVVLLSVASGAVIDEYDSRGRERTRWIEGVRETAAREADAPSGEVFASRDLASLSASERRSLDRALDDARARGDQGEASRASLPTRGTIAQALAIAGAEAVPARNLADTTRMALDLMVLLVAIGGVSWLTMARVVRGQVLSLKSRAFIEAARAIGVSTPRLFVRHLLPNLMGPIIVYATLTVPQAILQESFLSFLGIGVRAPLPSWGNLAADGLGELNPYRSHWWMMLFPCVLLGATLLALNFVGEWLRERMDPKAQSR